MITARISFSVSRVLTSCRLVGGYTRCEGAHSDMIHTLVTENSQVISHNGWPRSYRNYFQFQIALPGVIRLKYVPKSYVLPERRDSTLLQKAAIRIPSYTVSESKMPGLKNFKICQRPHKVKVKPSHYRPWGGPWGSRRLGLP